MKNWKLTLAVAAVSILGTLGLEHFSILTPVQAQSSVGDFALFAGVRRDTEKNQSLSFTIRRRATFGSMKMRRSQTTIASVRWVPILRG